MKWNEIDWEHKVESRENPGRWFRMEIENKEIAMPNNNHLNDYKSDVNIVSNDRKERERGGDGMVGRQATVIR